MRKAFGLAALAVAVAWVAAGKADDFNALAPADKTKLSVEYGGNHPSRIVSIIQNGKHAYFVVQVTVSWTNAEAWDKVTVQVFDENTANWVVADPVGELNQWVTVTPQTLNGSATFEYAIMPGSQWETAILNGTFPLAAVHGEVYRPDPDPMKVGKVAATVDQWVEYTPPKN